MQISGHTHGGQIYLFVSGAKDCDGVTDELDELQQDPMYNQACGSDEGEDLGLEPEEFISDYGGIIPVSRSVRRNEGTSCWIMARNVGTVEKNVTSFSRMYCAVSSPS